MGKGSTRRPAQVPNAVVDANWERIFAPRKQKPVSSAVRDARNAKMLEEACRGCGYYGGEHDATCPGVSDVGSSKSEPSKEDEVKDRKSLQD